MAEESNTLRNNLRDVDELRVAEFGAARVRELHGLDDAVVRQRLVGHRGVAPVRQVVPCGGMQRIKACSRCDGTNQNKGLFPGVSRYVQPQESCLSSGFYLRSP